MMVKRLVIVGLCLVLGSSLNAREISKSETFVGLEVGYAEVQGDTGGFFGEANHKSDDAAYGFRIGAQNGPWRTMFIFDYYDSSDDQNVEVGLLAVDYFFTDANSIEQSTFRPYLGANVGYANYESTNIDTSDFVYGGQVGFVVDIMNTLDLDLSYRYSLSNATEFDHMGNFVLGLNYLY